jgi:hypothetical protein
MQPESWQTAPVRAGMLVDERGNVIGVVSVKLDESAALQRLCRVIAALLQ